MTTVPCGCTDVLIRAPYIPCMLAVTPRLHLIQGSVAPAPRDELGVAARLDDLAAFEHQDLVGHAYCREAVADQQCRLAGHQLAEPREQLVLRRGIQRRGRLVQDDQGRIAHEGPGQRHLLPLASRQLHAPREQVRELCLVPPRQLRRHLVQLCPPDLHLSLSGLLFCML
jgi:hypothetical protein